SSAAAIPLRAAPTTTTWRPTTENASSPMPSPQLQRRQTEQRKDDRRDQKTGDDLRLAPSDQLEVVMERRHLEHTFAGELEGGDLDDHRHPLEHEDAADDRQQQFLLDENGHGAERAAQGQRTDVAHENLGGITVVPKEAETGPGQRAAEDRQLARREADQQQILRKLGVPG